MGYADAVVAAFEKGGPGQAGADDRIERGETHPDLDQLEAILAAIPGAPTLAQVVAAASRARQVTTAAEPGEAFRLG